MNMILNNEQIKEMRDLQDTLDTRIMNEKEIPLEADLTLEKYIALKTEFFEFVNEIESFKFWKENKGKSNILEEACDTLHFLLSLANDNHIDINEELLEVTEGLIEKDYETNEIIGLIDAMISDCYIEKSWISLNLILSLMLVMLNQYGYKASDLYDCYVVKNKINHERQDNKY